MSARPASICVAISAILWRIAWNWPIAAAERLALAGVGEGQLEAAASAADGAERHQQPLPLEVGHDQLEAAVLLAEQVLGGDEDVVEGELSAVSEACQPSFSSFVATS